ncbi:Uncharacterised protein [Salmonella enterica subsp. enterica serovar Bovismorbificans]|nr:Uncharacterised protein [Salmonella enterica subsp. enterica serovar Bovismorbificans]
MPQRFVPGAAAATADILRASGAGKQRRHPVTQLNPRDGGLRDGAILAGDVQNLRPEPFAGVNAANIAGVVDLAWLMAQTSDFVGLFHGGVIFPQHKHRIRVLGELWTQRQDVTVGVNRRWRRAGAVNANANDICALRGA